METSNDVEKTPFQMLLGSVKSIYPKPTPYCIEGIFRGRKIGGKWTHISNAVRSHAIVNEIYLIFWGDQEMQAGSDDKQ